MVLATEAGVGIDLLTFKECGPDTVKRIIKGDGVVQEIDHRTIELAKQMAAAAGEVFIRRQSNSRFCANLLHALEPLATKSTTRR